jgi:hypothetical protein
MSEGEKPKRHGDSEGPAIAKQHAVRDQAGQVSASEIVWAVIGGAVIVLVFWQIRRHGAVASTLDVDPGSGGDE